MADLNLQEIHDTMVSVAFEAGKMILAANPTDISTDMKLNSADIVTETDKAVETLVSSSLLRSYPDFAFIGEETYQQGTTRVTDVPTFIVDPIDGTTNFVHGFPHACVSLGLAVSSQPAVGVIYNPYLDQLWTAIRGKGSYLTTGASREKEQQTKSKLPLAKNPAPLASLQHSLLATEWGNAREGNNYDVKTATFIKLCASKARGGHMAQGMRSLGSAALNICAVAAGQMDAYWEGGCWAWDVCAAWCVLAEAGGIMYGGNPGVYEPRIEDRVYFAVRGTPKGSEGGQKALVEEFWSVMGEGRLEYES